MVGTSWIRRLLRMAGANVIIIVESARFLVDTKGDELNDFHVPSIVAVGVALGTSSCK